MRPTGHGRRAHVTYRGTTCAGREVELCLGLDITAATAADAWARLGEIFGTIDPKSLEIEIRERPVTVGGNLPVVGPWPTRPRDLRGAAVPHA